MNNSRVFSELMFNSVQNPIGINERKKLDLMSEMMHVSLGIQAIVKFQSTESKGLQNGWVNYSLGIWDSEENKEKVVNLRITSGLKEKFENVINPSKIEATNAGTQLKDINPSKIEATNAGTQLKDIGLLNTYLQKFIKEQTGISAIFESLRGDGTQAKKNIIALEQRINAIGKSGNAFLNNIYAQEETCKVILGRIGLGEFSYLKLSQFRSENIEFDKNLRFLMNNDRGETIGINPESIKTLFGYLENAIDTVLNESNKKSDSDRIKRALDDLKAGLKNKSVEQLLQVRQDLETISRQTHRLNFYPWSIGEPAMLSASFLATCVARLHVGDAAGTGSLLYGVGLVPITFVSGAALIGTTFAGREWMQHLANGMFPAELVRRIGSSIQNPGKLKDEAIDYAKSFWPGAENEPTNEKKLIYLRKSMGDTMYAKMLSIITGGTNWLFSNVISISKKLFQGSLAVLSFYLTHAEMIGIVMAIFTGGWSAAAAAICNMLIRRGAVEFVMAVLANLPFGLAFTRTGTWFKTIKTILNIVGSFFQFFPADFFKDGWRFKNQVKGTWFEESLGFKKALNYPRKIVGGSWNLFRDSIATVLGFLDSNLAWTGIPEAVGKSWAWILNWISEWSKVIEAKEIEASDFFGNLTVGETLEFSEFPLNENTGELSKLLFAQTKNSIDPVCIMTSAEAGRSVFYETPWSVLRDPINLIKNSLPPESQTDFNALAVICSADKEHINIISEQLNNAQKIVNKMKPIPAIETMKNGGIPFNLDPKIAVEMIENGKSQMLTMQSLDMAAAITKDCKEWAVDDSAWKIFMASSARIMTITDKYKPHLEMVDGLSGKLDLILTNASQSISTPPAEPVHWLSYLNWVPGVARYNNLTDYEQGFFTATILSNPDVQKEGVKAISWGIGSAFVVIGSRYLATLTSIWDYLKWTRNSQREGGGTNGVADTIEFFENRRVDKRALDPGPDALKPWKKQAYADSDSGSVIEEELDLSTQMATVEEDSENSAKVWISSISMLFEFASSLPIVIDDDEKSHLLICRNASPKYMQVLSDILDAAGEELNAQPALRFMRAQTNPKLQFNPKNFDGDAPEGLKNGPDPTRHLFNLSVLQSEECTPEIIEAAYRVFFHTSPQDITISEEQYMSRFALFIDSVILDGIMSLRI